MSTCVTKVAKGITISQWGFDRTDDFLQQFLGANLGQSMQDFYSALIKIIGLHPITRVPKNCNLDSLQERHYLPKTLGVLEYQILMLPAQENWPIITWECSLRNIPSISTTFSTPDMVGRLIAKLHSSSSRRTRCLFLYACQNIGTPLMLEASHRIHFASKSCIGIWILKMTSHNIILNKNIEFQN